MPLRDQLAKSIKPLLKESAFEVQDIKSNLYKTESLIKEHKGSTFCRHRLLLVSTKTEGFLSGLESYEYVLSEGETDKLIVYISKVDTTATLKKYQGLTARLVQGYIASLPASTSVFVFARAQPEYLFAESAKNESKSILNDRGLVCWWLSTLNKVSVKCEGWWSVPGIDDSSSALIEIGARKRGWQASDLIKWNYGTSFSDTAKASQVIPRFDDDAKSRLLRSLHGSEQSGDMTVVDFWNILSIGEECGSGKVTGFFELRLLGDQKDADPIKAKQDRKKSEFTIFWNKFMSLDFHDSEANLKSTQQVLEDIKSIFPNAEPIVLEKSAEETATTTNDATLPSPSEKRPAVNMLSAGFIKRKKI